MLLSVQIELLNALMATTFEHLPFMVAGFCWPHLLAPWEICKGTDGGEYKEGGNGNEI